MYTKQDLKALLSENTANITFTKIDGSQRKMKCTLRSDLLPIRDENQQTRKKTENEDVLAVWDLEQQAFRSLRVNSLISLSLNVG